MCNCRSVTLHYLQSLEILLHSIDHYHHVVRAHCHQGVVRVELNLRDCEVSVFNVGFQSKLVVWLQYMESSVNVTYCK